MSSKRIIPLWLRVIIAIGAICVITYYSIVPPSGVSSISWQPLEIIPVSYIRHFVAYAGLATVVGYATVHVPRPDWQVLIFILTTGTGIVIELIQYTLPTRTFSVLDITVNVLGVSVGILFVTGIGWISQKINHSSKNRNRIQ